MPKDRRTSPANTSQKSRYHAYKNRGKALFEADPLEASSGKKDWKDALCPICMDFPHNAVLLLCSSHDKGCRPYMCDTSYRHSNCLDQYQKAHLGKMKTCASRDPVSETSSGQNLDERVGRMWNAVNPTEIISSRQNVALSGVAENTAIQGVDEQTMFMEEGECRDEEGGSSSLVKGNVKGLICPLCRGEVTGWKVVHSAREHLNHKPRSCAQESCSFVGSYEELRVHARHEHPLARPSEIDPVRERNWSRMERRRDLGDVLSTIRSTMPGATVMGDYVIEHGDGEGQEEEEEDEEEEGDFPGDDGHWWTVFLLFQIFGPSSGSTNEGLRLRSQLRVPRRSLWGESLPRNTNAHVDSTTSSGSSDAEEIALESSRRRRRRQHRPDH